MSRAGTDIDGEDGDFHDGDDAAHDAPAVVGLLDDVLFERLGEVEVGALLSGWMV